MTSLDLETIERLTADRLGTFDVPCPTCGPERSSRAKQQKPVLRIWRLDPSLATFHCARCGDHGCVRNGDVTQPKSAVIAKMRAEAANHDRIAKAERLSKSRWLWSRRQAAQGSIVETYLRDARGYGGPIPATLGFLPARPDHEPAMIAAFGLPIEPEPGRLSITNDMVRGVHITRLARNGSGKAGSDKDKIMVGSSLGSPIVLAPANDLLGLAVTEGIEDGLSVQAATGLGVWVAGAASRLPALAEAIPAYIESITISVDDDDVGRRHASELARRLRDLGFDVRAIVLGLSASLYRSAA